MKSFISHNVHRIIDFSDSSVDRTSAQQCLLRETDILGQISTIVKFSHSKVTYTSDFLVSNNIQYECVLGWDFLNRNRLSLSRGSGKDYYLVGRHGKTPIRDNHESTTANLVGVTHNREQHSSTDRLLCQSTFQSNAVVAITIDARQGFSLARVVVEPDQHRVVPLRVINISHNPIELAAGENIADFCPLVESCSKTPTQNKPDICGAVQSDLSKTFIDKVNPVIDSSLTPDDRERVQRLLYKYSDVFDEKLGHTTLVSHKIDTGKHSPIKQQPRRLP